MKVILTHEVSGLGAAGDVLDVKDGYARNYLFPRKLATAWTAGGQKQVDSITKARESRAIKSLDDAKAVKAKLEGTSVTLSAKAGNSGRLFGAVSGSDLAAAVAKAGGPELDKRKIEVPGHIKTVGAYVALVRLHPEVQAKLAFEGYYGLIGLSFTPRLRYALSDSVALTLSVPLGLDFGQMSQDVVVNGVDTGYDSPAIVRPWDLKPEFKGFTAGVYLSVGYFFPCLARADPL